MKRILPLLLLVMASTAEAQFRAPAGETMSQIMPAGDGDLNALRDRANEIAQIAGPCTEYVCPEIDCDTARRLLQSLYEAETYLDAMLKALIQAQADADAHHRTLVGTSGITTANIRNAKAAIIVHEMLHGIGSALLDFSSLIDAIKGDSIQDLWTKDRMKFLEMVEKLDALYEALKDLEGLLNNVSQETLGAGVTPTGDATTAGLKALQDAGLLPAGQTTENLIKNFNDLKTAVSDALKALKELKEIADALKAGADAAEVAKKWSNVRFGIGQLLGNVLKNISAKLLEERKERLGELSGNLVAESDVVNSAYAEALRISNRKLAAEDALAAVRAARQALSACVARWCGSASYSRPSIPRFETLIEQPGDRPRLLYSWGSALLWLNAQLAAVAPRLQEGFSIEEGICGDPTYVGFPDNFCPECRDAARKVSTIAREIATSTDKAPRYKAHLESQLAAAKDALAECIRLHCSESDTTTGGDIGTTGGGGTGTTPAPCPQCSDAAARVSMIEREIATSTDKAPRYKAHLETQLTAAKNALAECIRRHCPGSGTTGGDIGTTGGGGTGTTPAPCPQCSDAAARVSTIEREIATSTDKAPRYKAHLEGQLAAARNALAECIRRHCPGSGTTTPAPCPQCSDAAARVSTIEREIATSTDKAPRYKAHLEGQLAAARNALAECIRRHCPGSGTTGGDIGTTGGGGTGTTPPVGVGSDGVAATTTFKTDCAPCQPIALELNRLAAERKALDADIAQMERDRANLAALQRERNQLQKEAEEIHRSLRPGGITGPRRAVNRAAAEADLLAKTARITQLNSEIERLENSMADRTALEQRAAAVGQEMDRLLAALADCEREKCPPQTAYLPPPPTTFPGTGTDAGGTLVGVTPYDPDGDLFTPIGVDRNVPDGGDLPPETPVLDLGLGIVDTPDPVDSGSTVTFTFTVANAGRDAARDPVLTIHLPPEMTVTSLPDRCSGSNPIICQLPPLRGNNDNTTIAIMATANMPAGGTVNTRASVTATGREIDPADNEKSEPTTIRGAVSPARTDLRVGSSLQPQSVPAGETALYVAEVVNGGPDGATGVRLEVNVGSGLTVQAAEPTQGTCTTSGNRVTCGFGALAAAAQARLNLQLRTGTASGPQTTTATVSGDQQDPNPGDNTTSITLDVQPPPPVDADLGITMEQSRSVISVFDPVRYTMVITNSGPATATNIVITDTIPAGMEFFFCSPTCEPGDVVVRCRFPSIPPGGSQTAFVDLRAAEPGQMTNRATVAGDQPDPNPSNNSASATTTVNP